MFRKKEQRLELPKEDWAIFDGHDFLSPSQPRYLLARRRRTHYLRLVLIVFVIGSIIIDTSIDFRLDWPHFPVIGAITILLDWILLARFEHRLARQLREHDRLLCTHCGYPLRGSEPHGRCPECGSEYDHDSLRVAWTNLRWAFWKPWV